jgi:ATP phosphoribosyltransferase regulatory subunit HisZ
LVFQGYAAGVGTALCSGGRYNDLIGHFGPGLPAIGFGLTVDLARLAVKSEANVGPDAVVQGCLHPQCLAAVQQMRERGLRVIVDTLGRNCAELAAHARLHNARAACCLEPGRWKLIERDGSARVMAVDHIAEEITTWTHNN